MDKQKRIEIVNSLINYLAEHEKSLFKSKHKIGEFKHDGKNLWFVDGFTNVAMRMTRSPYKNKKKSHYFSKGGTMWGLVRDFTDFIFGNDDSDGANGYGGLYCSHWGWPKEEMKKMREYAREIGYLKTS
ncbi:hypothetical protein COL01_06405 [Bacillus thuringiensis]|uniref:hypothetical protein n=1 Tax=Bacillus thuringiensis TaxID=1428 RepID=UPI000BF78C60|nr:hypothetical protein [Bacillus thuringiensis]PFV35958.1 hypothetical protein COL01_06405 [Bacillus thuringiensis]